MIVMLPIEVPASGYCLEGERVCQFYDFGTKNCDMGFILTDEHKPEGCRRLKNERD